MEALYPWQNEAWQGLQALRARMPHALLLKGPQGIGKLHLARHFARFLLCQQPQHAPCGRCNACHWFEQGNHPDFRLIQPETMEEEDEAEENAEVLAGKGKKKASREITVGQIRALSDFANMTSYCGGYRVVLIHPAEAMNVNAGNALLKTLEEPTENLLFILVAHRHQQLLPTITSRCLGYSVALPAQETSLAWLETQGVKEAQALLALSGFAPLRALEWQEAGEREEERLALQAAVSRPAQLEPLTLAESLQRSPPLPSIHFLQQWCHDLLCAKLTKSVRYFPEQKELMLSLAKDVPVHGLLGFQKELLEARRVAGHPLNARLFLESLLIAYRQMFT